MTAGRVAAGIGGDPLLITMRTDRDAELVSDRGLHERRLRLPRPRRAGWSFGYGRLGARLPVILQNRDKTGGHSYPDNWVPRFADAYRRQLADWIGAVRTGTPVGASAWDGYVASAIAEAIVAVLPEGREVIFKSPPRPSLYN